MMVGVEGILHAGFWCGHVRESTNWEKLDIDEILRSYMMGVFSTGLIWLSTRGSGGLLFIR
jgi:hypothetical protein